MDLLVILGATAAYIYSLVGLVFGLGNNYLFFESAASIITFVLIGGFIEQVAVKRTSSALNALRSLRPSRAKRVTDNGRVEEVAVEDLQVNNIVLLGVGDSVPCDGKVTAGTGDIDESTLTGEPIPATKDLNSKVFAGTTVVSGSLSVRVSSLGSDTVLGRIIDTVSSAQFGKPKIQRVGDKVSSIFVPAVIGIAAFTFLINLYFSIQLSDSLLRAIAVVVIACPCAMGLATPVAIMMCLGELARRGVLIKSGDVIEGLAGVKNAFFDKTGTLTKGVIEASLVTSKISEDKLGSIVLGLEQHSSHPIAKALVQKYCHLIPSRFESVEEKPGQGIFGSISDDFFAITKINNLNGGDIGVFKNNELVAAFALKDELRSEGSEAIAALKSMGISSYILSGDNSVRCKEVGATLTIPSHSGLLPEDKLRKIQELSSNQPSVFVGDGINDVLGLAGAGIGISFSNASDIAVKTAPVVITRADLRIIPEIVRYSKQVLRTIKQNLFWAFFYNVVAIPIAAFGLLTPTIAAIVMGLSDVVVVGNSLRLRRK
jgi:Cu+-exporting ATPase